MKRAVGYCVFAGSAISAEMTELFAALEQKGEGCEDFAKGVFLLNYVNPVWRCPRCLVKGYVRHEEGYAERTSNSAIFKEVRVEYNFDPVGIRFREIAIVRDEAVWGAGSKYTLMTPLIKTEQRALKVAEAILGNLQRNATVGDDIPKTSETLLYFDEDRKAFSHRLQRLGKEWERSSLVIATARDRKFAG